MPSAAHWARRHTEDVLAAWGLPDDVTATVVLVVSELVANGFKATPGGLDDKEQERYDREPASVPYERLAGVGMVRLRLSYDYVRVLVEVWDRSEAVPVLKDGGFLSESGRGLQLVDSLCERWGWFPAEEQTQAGRLGARRWRGKVVWGVVLIG